MYYNNYILLRLRLFTISPAFLFLLTIFACIACWSLDSIIMCENQTIEDLSNILSKDTIQYDRAMKDYKYYDDVRWEAVNNPIRDLKKIKYIDEKASQNIEEAMNVLAKIRKTESTLQKIEPSFMSNINKQWFEINFFNRKPFCWKP